MKIRQAFPNEIKPIMTVIESARAALAEAGSPNGKGLMVTLLKKPSLMMSSKDKPMSVSLTVKLFLMLRWLLMETLLTTKSMTVIGSITISDTLLFIGLPF